MLFSPEEVERISRFKGNLSVIGAPMRTRVQLGAHFGTMPESVRLCNDYLQDWWGLLESVCNKTITSYKPLESVRTVGRRLEKECVRCRIRSLETECRLTGRIQTTVL